MYLCMKNQITQRQQNKTQPSLHQPRLTFREVLEMTRESAAESAWSRAEQASRLRHLVIAQHRFRAARVLGEIKQKALRCVATLVPEQISLEVDSDYLIGQPSVCWPGHGRLHLPAETPLALADFQETSSPRAMCEAA